MRARLEATYYASQGRETMRLLLIIPALLLAGTAFAESEVKVPVKRIDAAATAPEVTEDTEPFEHVQQGAGLQLQPLQHDVTATGRPGRRRR